MECVDFSGRRRGPELGMIFPDWRAGEHVAFLSPHDDDAILGAGYLLQAVAEAGGTPHVLIFCQGDAGYSTAEAKETIVSVRKSETRRAYAGLGVAADHLVFFDVPDFALLTTLVRSPGQLGESVFDRLIAHLRAHAVSRIVFTSGHREHADHTAAFWHGLYTVPQAGDPILADLGGPAPIRSYLAYSVWSDFEPPDKPGALPADKGILADDAAEARVRGGMAEFASQGDILACTAAARREDRKTDRGYLELYRTYEIRRPIDVAAYKAVLAGLGKG